MTPQEEQLINSLVERVNQTQLQEKDPDAEALLNKGLGSNPDALYILAQSVLIQNIALDQAKAQVAQLQQQVQQARQQPAHATSFLGNLLGHHDPPPPQPVYMPPPPPPPGYDPQYAQPQYVQAGPPSFLRGAMQTAAGVAAGALAFEGVESILHGMGGFGHPGYGMGTGMGMMGGGGFERPVEETVVNNYYDQPGGQEHHFERGGLGQGGQEQRFHETADQGSGQLSDANFVQSGDDQGSLDNAGFDDNSAEDSVVQDDGSGFDDGGGGGFDGGGGDFS
ncbi:MAG: DUF2076 domain-containing protein [Terracidiphilus sp.]